jgi:hypothetical protein
VDKEFVRTHGGFSIRSPKTATNKNGRPVIKERIQAFERIEGLNMSSKHDTGSRFDYMQPSINSNYSNVIAQIANKQ